MIDPQAYRIRIGMFDVRTRGKMPSAKCIQHDCNALGLALILTLLIIGGVEQNPGPDYSESQLPGPSFSGVTLMDVMEAVRITQLQIDGLSSRMHDVTRMITDLSRDVNAVSKTHSTSHPTSLERPCPNDHASSKITTEVEARQGPASPLSPPNTASKACTTVVSHRKHGNASSPISAMPPVGAVMIGCQNVRRIAAAARDEFNLGSQVVFRSIRGGTARCVLGALHGAVACCNAVKTDLVLHVGGNEISHLSVEYTLECMAEVIRAAKHISKVRDIVLCSVPQDPSTPADVLSMKRADLNVEIESLCKSEGIQYLDLRSRLNESSYHGLDKSRLNLNRAGSRNAWQLLASEVTGFLD